MDLEFLAFLAGPAFVIPGDAVGVAGAAWVIYDEAVVNTPLNAALKWAMPIIVAFFSVIGLGLYWWVCRPPHVGDKHGDAAKQAFRAYVRPTYKKVNGSIVHCVGGDWLGIVSAMILARVLGFSFWQEFWWMISVMGGIGAVTGVVTPLVVGQQPKPDTAAFWGFAALGLLVGYVVTIPTNWMLVQVEWKHGLG